MKRVQSVLTFLLICFSMSCLAPGAQADNGTGSRPYGPAGEKPWYADILTRVQLDGITGQGIASDLSPADLEKTVGPGFISYLTPDDISRLDTRDILSQEARQLITGDLITLSGDQPITFVLPRSAAPDLADLATTLGLSPQPVPRGPFAVQVGIFQTRQKALDLLAQLHDNHFRASYIFATRNRTAQPLYAVRLGDFNTIKEPYIEGARFRKKENKPAVITYTNSLKAIPAEAWPEIQLSAAELAQTTGQGFATDMSEQELDQTVGTGLISNLTPEQLAKIDASGVLSTETMRLKTQHLAKIIARGITYMVDESKFSTAELEEIKGRGTTIKDIGRSPFSVQVGVYQVRENALTMLKKLQTQGYEPYIFQTTNEAGKNLFAVRLGDYQTIKSAYADATHFKRKEHKPAIVTYINSLQAVRPPEESLEKSTEPAAGDTPTTGAAGQTLAEPGKQYSSQDLNELYQEMLTLRQEVEKLKSEAEAREKLRLTEAEEEQEEEEILEAAGREYILAEKGTLSFDYKFGYSYNSYDQWTPGEDITIQHTADHSITNSVSTNYAMYDNLTLNASIPFQYKYQDIGTDDSLDVSDIGDISVGARWQVLKQNETTPPIILSASLSTPTGRSPYEINPDKDLSTGSGTWQFSLGTAANKTVDPVVAYASAGLSYAFPESGLDYHDGSGRTLEKIDGNYGIGLGMGVGYAMSYKATLNASISYSFSLGTTYHYDNGVELDTGSASSANLSVGMGWKLSSERTISVGLGIGLTNATSDYSLSFRIPFDFET